MLQKLLLGLACLALVACSSPQQDQPVQSKAPEPKGATKPTELPKASGNKVLRVVFPVAETGFDPVRVHDLYSNIVNESIFERLVTYDYLARPVRLVPQAAETLPEVSDNGRTWLFRIRKGIHFTPDPAFGGTKRELTAEDYAYTIKRFRDPRNRSVWEFLVEGKIVGLDELAEEAKKSGAFDYDREIPGLEVVDRHTLRIRLKEPDYNFAHILAMPTFGAVAREVIEKYAEDTNGHPVGTGPYKLGKWVRSSKIILEANTDYRGFVWDFAPGSDPADAEIVAAMKGRRMPQIDAVEVSVIDEEQSRWLAFQNNELDLLNLPQSFAPVAMPGNQLSKELAGKGIRLERTLDPEYTYTYFNMRDPVVGGFAREKIALRRALAMAYNMPEEIEQIRKGQAARAHHIVPPGIVGHDPSARSAIGYDPAAANQLLDRFGYRKGPDGYRTLPDGKPLVVRYSSQPTALDRQFDELWKKSLDAIGVKLEIHKDRFPELLKAEKQCRLMMRGAAWIADYPDGENFVQLLYGPNVHQSNNACYESKAYDALYVKAKAMPDSPERNQLFRDMMRQMEADTPWLLGVNRYRNMLIQPWVKGYKKHPILHAEWLYHDLDPARK